MALVARDMGRHEVLFLGPTLKGLKPALIPFQHYSSGNGEAALFDAGIRFLKQHPHYTVFHSKVVLFFFFFFFCLLYIP